MLVKWRISAVLGPAMLVWHSIYLKTLITFTCLTLRFVSDHCGGYCLFRHQYLFSLTDNLQDTDEPHSSGGPTAAVIALHNPNIRVTVVDKDETRICRWNSKHLPIYEPGLIDVVRVARDGISAIVVSADGDTATKTELPARLPNLFFSTDVSQCISEADIVFLSVNTNTKSAGVGAGEATNMVALESATTEIAVSAKPGTIIVEKSTVPCRTAQMVYETVSHCRASNSSKPNVSCHSFKFIVQVSTSKSSPTLNFWLKALQ